GDAVDVKISVRALDAQAAGAHGLEVGASRDEGDVGSGCGQASAKVAADAAAADDRDSHRIAIVACGRGYSYRSASIGSTRVARLAGRYPAASATTASTAAAAAMASGSWLERLNSCDWMTRLNAIAAGAPIATPMATIAATSRSTSHTTDERS